MRRIISTSFIFSFYLAAASCNDLIETENWYLNPYNGQFCAGNCDRPPPNQNVNGSPAAASVPVTVQLIPQSPMTPP